MTVCCVRVLCPCAVTVCCVRVLCPCAVTLCCVCVLCPCAVTGRRVPSARHHPIHGGAAQHPAWLAPPTALHGRRIHPRHAAHPRRRRMDGTDGPGMLDSFFSPSNCGAGIGGVAGPKGGWGGVRDATSMPLATAAYISNIHTARCDCRSVAGCRVASRCRSHVYTGCLTKRGPPCWSQAGRPRCLTQNHGTVRAVFPPLLLLRPLLLFFLFFFFFFFFSLSTSPRSRSQLLSPQLSGMCTTTSQFRDEVPSVVATATSTPDEAFRTTSC